MYASYIDLLKYSLIIFVVVVIVIVVIIIIIIIITFCMRVYSHTVAWKILVVNNVCVLQVIHIVSEYTHDCISAETFNSWVGSLVLQALEMDKKVKRIQNGTKDSWDNTCLKYVANNDIYIDHSASVKIRWQLYMRLSTTGVGCSKLDKILP